MPTYKIRDPKTNQLFDMPWSGVNEPTSADIDYFLNTQQQGGGSNSWTKGGLLDPSVPWTDKLRNVFSGPSTYNVGGKNLPVVGDEPGAVKLMRAATSKLANIIDNPNTNVADRGTVLPFIAGGIQGIGDIVAGGFSPQGSGPRVPKVSQPSQPRVPKLLPPAPPEIEHPTRFYAGNAGVAEAGKTYPLDLGEGKLPPFQVAPESTLNGRTLPETQATVTPADFGEIVQLPAIDAANRGTNLGDIPQLRTDSVQDVLGSLESAKTNPIQLPKPTPTETPIPYEQTNKGAQFAAQPTIGDIDTPVRQDIIPPMHDNPSLVAPGDETAFNAAREGNVVKPRTPEEIAYENIMSNKGRRPLSERARSEGGWIGTKPEDVSKQTLSDMEAELARLDKQRKGLPTDSTTTRQPSAGTITQPKSIGTTTPNNTPYRSIPENADAKTAVKQWADGTQAGAAYRGNIIKERFSDLSDPSLIDRFESGDRTGRLAEVQEYFDNRWQQAQDLHLLKEDQKRLNYLRHYFEQNPEEVSKAIKQYIAKNPQFAKEGKFPTYAKAREYGLTQKYSSIPEIMEAYETEFNKAVRTKELVEWLDKTGRLDKSAFSKKMLKSGALPTDIGGVRVKGPDAEEIQSLINNVTSRSHKAFDIAGDISSLSKNITLAGGVPGTKYNMHAWNIFKNDMANAGYLKGAREFFTDPTGKKAVEWAKNLSPEDKNILADLVDRGWQGRPMHDVGKEVNFAQKLADKAKEGTILRKGATGVGKVIEGSQKLFEDPLFQRSLPALSAKRTLEAYKGLLKEGMNREEALAGAAKIGNEFYGGVDSVLRDPNLKDLSRVTFLAPNWMESQLRKAVSQWKGLGKVVAGTATPVDKIYAKSLGRSAVLPSIGTITGGLTAGKKLAESKLRDIGAIPLGTIKEKNDRTKLREVPTLTTANEEWRVPVAAPIEMFKGNVGALKDILIKNRIALPLNTVWDVVHGQDTFGNPLTGETRYGKKIPFKQGLMNYVNEASRPAQHQVVQALVRWLRGDITGEEATALGLELPINYSSNPKTKKMSTTGPRVRIPRPH